MKKNNLYDKIYLNNFSSWNFDWNKFLNESINIVLKNNINNILYSNRTNIEYNNIYLEKIINFNFKNYIFFVFMCSFLFTFKYNFFSLSYFIISLFVFSIIIPFVYIFIYIITSIFYKNNIKPKLDNEIYFLTDTTLCFLNKKDEKIDFISLKIEDIEKYKKIKHNSYLYYEIFLKDKTIKKIISKKEEEYLDVFLNNVFKEETKNIIIYKDITV